MRVALGTVEIDDETRKKIRKLAGGKGDATRQEVKDYLLTALESDVIPFIGQEPSEPAAVTAPDDEAVKYDDEPADESEPELVGAGGSNEELPYPPTGVV